MNKYLIAGIALFGLVACNSADQFKIAGTVENAAKETMYLEHIGLLKTDLLDSVVLSKDGEFKFKAPRPEYPDFYRLRIGAKTIDFAVDSCETITVKADAKSFASSYQLEGSQTSNDIQQLRKSVSDIQRKVNGLTPELSAAERNAKVAEIRHSQYIKSK